MEMQLATLIDLGLKDALRNGLAVIRGDTIEEARRAQVLDSLVQVFSEASRGSQVLATRSLLSATDDRPAFERFALFFRYLKDKYESDLPTRLSEAANALSDLRDGDLLDRVRRERVREMLENLLEALRRESALVPLVPPQDIHYG